MAAGHVPWVSPEEYLEQEESAESRHEYFDGVITAKAGGTIAHSTLAANLGAELRAALRGRGCRTVGSDLLFRTGAGKLYTYPDVAVYCGKVATMENRRNVVTNPIFVAEVLSDSTEGFDRGAKSRAYRRSESIRQFALLSQSEPLIELHTRGDGGVWTVTEVSGIDVECAFSSLACAVPMASLYEGVLDVES